MQYDNQLFNLKNTLPNIRNVLIALPSGANIDKLAAGLALYMSLSTQGKEVSIVCEDAILVGQSHLFSIDRIKNTLPTGQGGNFVLTLEGVATQGPGGGSVPSLDKLDYAVEGNNLNLVFKVLPGQNFQPARIVPHYQSSNFEAIFVVGGGSLANLGSIYGNNMQAFNGANIINIDNGQNNTNFGQSNVVDPNASSVSEIMTFVMPGLGLPVEGDVATNLITGIFDTTANLTSPTTGANTFEAVSLLMKSGGKKPQQGGFNVNPVGFSQPQQPQFQPVSQPVVNQQSQPNSTFPSFGTGPQFDLSVLMPPVINNPAPTVNPQPAANAVNTSAVPAPSQEERPYGEGVVSESEPDWLTPKIFKGTSLG